MGKIIAIANQKGGVGKTSTAINLSAGLAEKGKKVLLVDLDSQSNATSGSGIEKSSVEKGTYEVLSGEATLEECVRNTAFDNFFVIPSSVDLAAAEIELLDVEDRNEYLKNALEPIKNQYDFIIIDCPPSLNMLTINAMTAADSVIVPIQCEYYALEGLSQLLQTIKLVKERLNPELEIEGLLFTMYDGRVRLSGQVVSNVKHNLDERIFKTVIPRNIRIAEAPSHGKPVMHYARFCSGTRAYRNLSKELIAANEEWLKEHEKKLQDEQTEETANNAGQSESSTGDSEDMANTPEETTGETAKNNQVNTSGENGSKVNDHESTDEKSDIKDSEADESEETEGNTNRKESSESETNEPASVKAENKDTANEKDRTSEEETDIKDISTADGEGAEGSTESGTAEQESEDAENIETANTEDKDTASEQKN